MVLTTIIPEQLADHRLDQALAELFPDYSRSRIQEWIRIGNVLVDDEIVSQRYRLKGGERIEITTVFEPQHEWQAEDIALEIIHEDEDLLVINKPAGLVVHPGAGNPHHTLLNALLHHYPELKLVPRAGIVHRLDKDTTGLMVIAKNPIAHTHLVEAMQERHIHRQYQALVRGKVTAGGIINKPIGRHPRHRTRMAVVDSGRPAITHYRVLERFASFTLLQCRLETGRTHQIRVHMAHIHHPIVGDPVYGGRSFIPKDSSPALIDTLRGFGRQALHACELSLEHPTTGESMTWQAPLPDDFIRLLDLLRHGTTA